MSLPPGTAVFFLWSSRYICTSGRALVLTCVPAYPLSTSNKRSSDPILAKFYIYRRIRLSIIDTLCILDQLVYNIRAVLPRIVPSRYILKFHVGIRSNEYCAGRQVAIPHPDLHSQEHIG